MNLDAIPGEDFLISCLQRPMSFSIKNKIIKKGRLLLFRRSHYFIRISLETARKTTESFDIPLPFAIEHYEDDGLLYFDYRLPSLNVSSLPKLPEKVGSVYFDNILEIQVD